MSDLKNYCYKADCDIVLTGFNIEQYYVFRQCKVEVTESLKKQKAKSKPEVEEQYGLWGIDLDGDDS